MKKTLAAFVTAAALTGVVASPAMAHEGHGHATMATDATATATWNKDVAVIDAKTKAMTCDEAKAHLAIFGLTADSPFADVKAKLGSEASLKGISHHIKAWLGVKADAQGDANFQLLLPSFEGYGVAKTAEKLVECNLVTADGDAATQWVAAEKAAGAKVALQHDEKNKKDEPSEPDNHDKDGLSSFFKNLFSGISS